jgi:transposase
MMPRRIQIAAHLSVKALGDRYRQSKAVIERSHYQTIWLLAQGRRSEEVAQVTGYSRDWIYKLVRDYNQHGPAALGDQRHHNPGATPLLNDMQQAQLLQALSETPIDGDLWDGPKVAQWMSDLLARPIHPQRGWEYLKAMEMRLVKPRPAHVESDPVVQAQWKKNSNRPWMS